MVECKWKINNRGGIRVIKGICCFSGHRIIDKGELAEVISNTENAVEKLISQGVDVFYSGGAVGFDTLAADIIMHKKLQYPNIKLIVVLPYHKTIRSCEKHDGICNMPDEIITLSDNYYPGCMHVRNRYMVDRSTHLICYCMRDQGGTAYTLKYAKKASVDIILV